MKMKAGVYYVGDPCYVYGQEHDEWLNFLNKGVWQVDNEPFKYKGFTCFCGCAKWGDGQYVGSDGFLYLPDTGMIGAIPVDMVDKPYCSDFSKIVTFEEDFDCYVEDGVISIGHITIDTDPEEIQEEPDVCSSCGVMLDSYNGYVDLLCEQCEEE